MSASYDVIVVGSRCAGAALATHLARAGSRVLLLDASKQPSDLVLSTHYVQPPGMDALDELGVGDRLRAVAPPTRSIFVRAESAELLTRLPEGRAGYCVRRFKLDAWLQEAATSAGAELRDRTPVVELIRQGDRVAGVVVETAAGRESIRAGLVVGADGAQSTIAKLTGVEEYLGFDMTRGCYWSYWPMPASWKSGQRRGDQLFVHEGDDLRMVMQADDDQLVVVTSPPRELARSWGRDYREKYLEYLRRSRHIAPLIENSAPSQKVVGAVAMRCFYRRPVGPGFALVGDAGTFKDPVTAQGITDALLGAKQLASAIADGKKSAFERYWRERDVLTLPLYYDAQRLGELGANHAFTRLLFASLNASVTLRDRPGLMMDRKISPFALVPNATVLRWVLGAALRGNFDAVRRFRGELKRAGVTKKELAARKRLLAEVEA